LQDGNAHNTLISMIDTANRIPALYKAIAIWIERSLALVILGGVFVFGLSSMQTLSAMNWREIATFDELIYRVLLLVIAVELARTLVTHDLRAILELLAFVVARKMLKLEASVSDILMCVLAFVALLAAHHLWLSAPLPPKGGNPENTTRPNT
jgi:hypothetical protein